MHAQLAELLTDYRTALEWLDRLDREYSDEEWTHRPSEVSWSAAECIAHLNLTAEAYLPLLRKGIDRARALTDRVPEQFRRDLGGWLVWKASRPGGGMKVRTTGRFVPLDAAPKPELVSEFRRLQDEQTTLLTAADGLPIHRVKIISPFNSRLKYSVYSSFTILPAHEHRHLGQAERALADARSQPRPPASPG